MLTDEGREGIRQKAARMAAAAPGVSDSAKARLRSLLRPRAVEAPDDYDAAARDSRSDRVGDT